MSAAAHRARHPLDLVSIPMHECNIVHQVVHPKMQHDATPTPNLANA